MTEKVVGSEHCLVCYLFLNADYVDDVPLDDSTIFEVLLIRLRRLISLL